MERVYEMINILQKAFPQGIDEVYQDLIGCLKDEFSVQNLAALLSYVNGLDIHIVKRDILHFDQSTLNKEVLEKLQEAGYDK